MQNRKSLLLSFSILLMPILFGLILWDYFPSNMNIEIAPGELPAGITGRHIILLGLPIFLLILQLGITPRILIGYKEEQKTKFSMPFLLWSIPVCSLFLTLSMYAYTLEPPNLTGYPYISYAGAVILYLSDPLSSKEVLFLRKACSRMPLLQKDTRKKLSRFCGIYWIICGLILLLVDLLTEMPLILSWVLNCILTITIPVSYFAWLLHKDKNRIPN